MPGTGVPANYLRDSWFFPPWPNLSGTVQMSHIHEKKSRGWSGSVPDFLKYLTQGKSWETFIVFLSLEWRQNWCLSALFA